MRETAINFQEVWTKGGVVRGERIIRLSRNQILIRSLQQHRAILDSRLVLSASNGEENRKGRNIASWDGVHGTRSGRNDCKQVTRDDNNDDGRDDGRRFRHLKNYVYRVPPPPSFSVFFEKSKNLLYLRYLSPIRRSVVPQVCELEL